MQGIFLVRHGESEANAARIVTGQSNPPLTDVGIEQATSAAGLAKNEKLRFDLIVSSPLERAHHTAKIIAAELGYPQDDIVIRNELLERGCGDFEGGPVDDYYEAPESSAVNEHHVESLDSMYERTERFVEWLKDNYPDKTVLIVAHSGIGKMLRIVYEGRDASELDKTVALPNAVITRLV